MTPSFWWGLKPPTIPSRLPHLFKTLSHPNWLFGLLNSHSVQNHHLIPNTQTTFLSLCSRPKLSMSAYSLPLEIHPTELSTGYSLTAPARILPPEQKVLLWIFFKALSNAVFSNHPSTSVSNIVNPLFNWNIQNISWTSTLHVKEKAVAKQKKNFFKTRVATEAQLTPLWTLPP